MSALLERPRVAAAVGAALVAIIVLAMLAGGAIAGGDECPAAGGAGDSPRTQRQGSEA